MWVPELVLPPNTIRMFGPKTAILPPKYASWAHIGLADLFGALLVDWLLVVVRGAYLASHPFTLYNYYSLLIIILLKHAKCLYVINIWYLFVNIILCLKNMRSNQLFAMYLILTPPHAG